MLDFANNHKEKLEKLLQIASSDLKYKYYNVSRYGSIIFEIETSTWNKVSFVSLNDKNEVKGFISVSFDNPYRSASLTMFNTEDNMNFLFDVKVLIKKLFTIYKVPRIHFSVLIGNPIEYIYDREVLKLGGRMWGISEKSILALDGEICSQKHYEILRENYTKLKEKE